MSDPKKPSSVTRKGRGITVGPSPLNGVKLELGLILILLPLVWLVTEKMFTDVGTQTAVLAAFTVTASLWLLLRTRHTLRRLQAQGGNPEQADGDGAH